MVNCFCDFIEGLLLSGECVINFLGSVSSQQKYEVMDGPALQPWDGPEFQLRVTAQFYLESKGKYILEV